MMSQKGFSFFLMFGEILKELYMKNKQLSRIRKLEKKPPLLALL